LTKRLIASEDLIVVGAAGMYEARCRRCFEPNLASLGVASKKKKTELAATAGSK
jgi:thymidine kinase